jgi:serine protease Do
MRQAISYANKVLIASLALGSPTIPVLAQSSQSNLLDDLSQDIEKIADQARKSVVMISASKIPEPAHGVEDIGSGFFIDLAKRYVVTSNHIVEGADKLHVKVSNGKMGTAILVGRDRSSDLAVLKVGRDLDIRGVEALRFSNEPTAKLGELVLALGAPYGLEASFSLGIVSAIDRGTLGITKVGNYLQTDASINPGNSGGALIGSDGSVVGVNTAIYSSSGSYSGIGFAVPAGMAKEVVARLIREGKVERGYLGLSLQNMDYSLVRTLRLPQGKNGGIVVQVAEDGPAKRARVRTGDVIVSVNESSVKSADELTNILSLMKPGEKIKLSIWRNGKEIAVNLKLQVWPYGDEVVLPREQPVEDKSFGLTLGPLTQDLRTHFDVRSDSGVIVLDVVPGSAADIAGISIGDIIVSLNHISVNDDDKANALLRSGKDLLVYIERKDGFRFFALERSAGDENLAH